MSYGPSLKKYSTSSQVQQREHAIGLPAGELVADQLVSKNSFLKKDVEREEDYRICVQLERVRMLSSPCFPPLESHVQTLDNS